MESNNEINNFNTGLLRYKRRRWSAWWWLGYFTMYNLINVVLLIRNREREDINSLMILYGILIPIFTMCAIYHANTLITLYKARLRPLLIEPFKKEFATEVWKSVYTTIYQPTAMIFVWINILASIAYPIFFATYFNKWWTWTIYAIVLLIDIVLVLFTITNLYEFHKISKSIYNQYEGESK